MSEPTLKCGVASLELEYLRRTVLDNPFIPQTPTARQAEFLAATETEVLYGGAGGGGKSSALLMAALQYVDRPGYAALLLRKTIADLRQPDALIPRSMDWLMGRARWNGNENAWHFPSRAVVRFGYLQHPGDEQQYASAAFQCICFDELTQFAERVYRFMFSRLRRPVHSDIPLRVRGGSNPGGLGHDWVKRRFLDEGPAAGRLFIPARLMDNPHLDAQSYMRSLAELDPITRRQILDGDWSARHGGSIFRREWFKVLQAAPAEVRNWCRFWDLAATEDSGANDPDWTAGALLGSKDGVWYLRDVRRLRGTPAQVEALVRQTAAVDGRDVPVRMEEEPGASGKSLVSHYARNVLAGYNFLGVKPHRDKVTRAAPLSSAAESGNLVLVEGPWIGGFLDQAEAFPTEGAHDDEVDAVSGAFGAIANRSNLQVALI